MFALKWVKSLTGTAVSAARHPVTTVGQVAGHARTVASTGTAVVGVAKSTAARLVSQPQSATDSGAVAEAVPTATNEGTAPVVEPPAEVTPEVVLREPAPPLAPPVDIVEQVLAAEDDEPHYGGHATEPKAASRDEEHGDAALQRAEAEEIAEEVAEAFPAGAIDIETPVGTTGADVGFNPDTAEADLQQPGTPPLVDAATANAVASEMEIGKKAAAIHKAATKKAPAKKTTAKKTTAKKTTAKKTAAKDNAAKKGTATEGTTEPG